MTTQDIDIKTKEGQLLVPAVYLLINEGPERFKGKTPDEIIAILENLAKTLSET